MQILKTIDISRELMENIFVTAIEGGSNYWYDFSPEQVKAVRTAVPKTEDQCFSTAIFKAVWDKGVDIFVSDIESDEVIGCLSIKLIPQRLQRLCSDERYSWALDNELNDNGDAESSDIIFQFLCMNEVIYG